MDICGFIYRGSGFELLLFNCWWNVGVRDGNIIGKWDFMQLLVHCRVVCDDYQCFGFMQLLVDCCGLVSGECVFYIVVCELLW